ncbi:MAG: hypothetical protein R2796_08680 [Chitinophagaceae bacterium]
MTAVIFSLVIKDWLFAGWVQNAIAIIAIITIRNGGFLKSWELGIVEVLVM